MYACRKSMCLWTMMMALLELRLCVQLAPPCQSSYWNMRVLVGHSFDSQSCTLSQAYSSYLHALSLHFGTCTFSHHNSAILHAKNFIFALGNHRSAATCYEHIIQLGHDDISRHEVISPHAILFRLHSRVYLSIACIQ